MFVNLPHSAVLLSVSSTQKRCRSINLETDIPYARHSICVVVVYYCTFASTPNSIYIQRYDANYSSRFRLIRMFPLSANPSVKHIKSRLRLVIRHHVSSLKHLHKRQILG